VVLLFAAIDAPARSRVVHSRLDPSRILVIVAHPDDEVLLAPFLARRCVHGAASCTVVVMTHGGAGDVRAAEMAESAALLDLELIHWSFPDVMVSVGETWASYAGGRAEIVRELEEIISFERPDMILTFDPEHGSTCHPAHREIARLVLETGADDIFQIETAAQFVGNGFVLSNGAPGFASVYFANDDWEYAVRVAALHASQFSAEQIESLRTLPAEQRRVWLMPVGLPSATRCGS
jgi:LmbE family N-acetylglucosaminyl deacetylase